MHRSIDLKTIAILAVAAAACSDSTGTNARPVSVSFSTQASAGTAADRATGLDINLTVGANTIVITKAQVVLRKIELHQNVAASCPDDDSLHEDCGEVKVGPLLVDLPLTATATSSIVANVPQGTYSEAELQIHKPTNRPADQAFVAANPAFANTSIRVEGTFNGSPFVYTSDMTDVIELAFNPPVTIDADNQNVTIAFDLNSWFMVNGQVINPTTANSGGANETAVRNNIRASLRGFEDDDKNGHDEADDHH